MKVKKFTKRNELGFTLVELMVVVTIIGILLVLLLPRMTLLMDRSREKTTHKNLKSIKLAIDSYSERTDGGYNYPTAKDDLKQVLEEKFSGSVPRAVLKLGSGIPASSECELAGSVTDIPVGNNGGWVFITAGPDRGNVYVNSTAFDTNQNPYTTYSCW
ncbi:MAG: prepilin-type N-terminal cleavage/methylation domain-containing protein [bacterium]